MYITKLTMFNFMPFKGQHAVDMPFDGTKNVVIVFGDNMKGKTSLLNALRWTFYGRVFDRYRAEIPVNRLVNSDAAVAGEWRIEAAVQFEHGGAKYDLVRSASRRKGVSTPQRNEDFEITTQLVRDGVAIRGDLIEHVIDQIVPEQISRFFLFDGELLQEYESLLRDDGDQGRRIKSAIEDVLGVPSLVHGKDELRSLKKPFERQLSQDLKKYTSLAHFTNQMQEYQREMENLEADKVALEAKLVDTRRLYQDLSRDVDASENKYSQKSQLDALVAEKGRLEEQDTALDQQRVDIAKDAWRDMLKPALDAKRNLLQKEIEEATEHHSSESDDQQIGYFRLQALGSGSCPVCLQGVAGPVAEAIRARTENESYDRKIMMQALTKIAAANEAVRKLSDFKYVGAKKRISEIDSAARRQAVEITKLTNTIADLRRELEGFDTDEMGRVRRQAEQANHAVRILEQKLEDNGKALEKNRVARESLRHVINQDKDARGQKSSKIVDLVSSLEGVFSKAIDRLRDDLKSTVQERATFAFKAMTTDKTYQGLRMNDNYGLTIVDKDGRDVTLRSAGAEQIVALSLIDGLNQTGRGAGPVLMDTPFGRLDPKHRANVLKHLPESATQVVLFVHEGELRKQDLDPVASKIGAVYSIEAISSSQSRIVKDRR